MDDKYYMDIALEEAQKAFEEGEVPIGAVVVDDLGKVISKAHNRRENDKNATYHAELMAIDSACKALGGWRLPMCTLYVTLEPCVMCAGAIVNSRIRKVFYGAKDPKQGAFGGLFDLNTMGLCHKPKTESGLMEKQATELLNSFFENLRKKKQTD
jgi:tRNA(adenine34) deaminase